MGHLRDSDGKVGSDAGRAFPILQCKRDVVGVRKRSSLGKGLYSENVHRYRQEKPGSEPYQASSSGSNEEQRSKDRPITRNTAASRRGA